VGSIQSAGSAHQSANFVALSITRVKRRFLLILFCSKVNKTQLYWLPIGGKTH
jgi:hypothetical protein